MSPLQRNLAIALFAVAMPACNGGQPAAPGEPVVTRVEGRQEVLVGAKTTAVIGRATTVHAFRVLNPFAPEFGAARKGKRLIDEEYPILAQARVDQPTTARLVSVLLDPNTYDSKYARDCNFDPRHAVRFETGTDVVDVIICFKCEDLAIVPGQTLRERGGTHPFGRAGKPLYEAMVKIFPQDRRR